MRPFLLYVLASLACSCYGQGFSYPAVPLQGRLTHDFVPAGWAVRDSARGDLNGDGGADAALVLQRRDSVTLVNASGDTVTTQPRILVVLFRTAAHALRLAEQSNTFILPHDNPAMEDPYRGMTIAKGSLRLRFRLFYNMGSWYVTESSYQFRYQQAQFVLIGADYTYRHRGTAEVAQYSYNFLTGKRSKVAGSDKQGFSRPAWKQLNLKTRKTLKTFRAPFTWEVEQDIYL